LGWNLHAGIHSFIHSLSHQFINCNIWLIAVTNNHFSEKSILLFNQQFLVYKLKFVELVEQCYIVWTWKQSQTLKSQSKRR
jgi:hypothetical protein